MAGKDDEVDPSFEAAWDSDDSEDRGAATMPGLASPRRARAADPVEDPDDGQLPDDTGTDNPDDQGDESGQRHNEQGAQLPGQQPAPESAEEAPVIAAMRQLQEEHRTATESLRGEVGSLSAQLRQVNAEAAIAKQMPGGPSAAEIDAAAQDPDSWKAFKEEWDTWAKPIEEFMDHRVSAAIAAASKLDEQRIANLVQAQTRAEVERYRREEAQQAEAVRQAQVAYDAARNEVLGRHPDFDTVRNSPGFDEWARQQSENVQRLRLSNDARDAIFLMDNYKATLPPPPPQVTAVTVQAARAAKARATAVPGRTITAAPQSAIDTRNLTFEEAWELDDQIKAAKAARQRPNARA